MGKVSGEIQSEVRDWAETFRDRRMAEYTSIHGFRATLNGYLKFLTR